LDGLVTYVQRKDDGEITKAALQRNPQGSRKRGRPKYIWGRSGIKERGEVGKD
jgi:hypothetical protein